MLAVVEGGKVFVLDAFNGEVLKRFSNGASEGGVPMEAAISADNKYVLQGEEYRKCMVDPDMTVCVNWHADPDPA